MLSIDADYTTRTLQDLVRINSVNPRLDPAAPGESAIAVYVADTLRALGLDVSTHEPQPGRVSVVGRLRGSRPGRSLMSMPMRTPLMSPGWMSRSPATSGTDGSTAGARTT